MRLLIAIPGAGMMYSRAFFHITGAILSGSVWWTKKFGEAAKIDFMVTERMPVAEARNALTERAIELNADYVWWIDDDMKPPVDTLQRLFRMNTDIATAFCVQRTLPPCVMGFRFEGNKSKILVGDEFEGIWTIDGAGMACILFTIGTLKKAVELTDGIPFQGGKYAVNPKARVFGTEELFMFSLLSAHGIKTLMDTDLDCPHIGIQEYDKSLMTNVIKKEEAPTAGRDAAEAS